MRLHRDQMFIAILLSILGFMLELEPGLQFGILPAFWSGCEVPRRDPERLAIFSVEPGELSYVWKNELPTGSTE